MIRLWKSFYLLVLVFLIGCQEKKDDQPGSIELIWKDGRASGISVARKNFDGIPGDSIPWLLHVKLADHGRQPSITGNYTVKKDSVFFEPLLPFTRGLRYEVYIKDKRYGEMSVPKDTAVPKLLALYPGGDTLPENLLKIYLVFSLPMQESQSSKYVKLLNEKGDSLPDVFLNLQSELWNEDGTVLTLWLNPGRIKRDLQPNRLMGPPLTRGKHYQFAVAAGWPGKQGTIVAEKYTKQFVAAERDTISPTSGKWNIITPAYNTMQPLMVELGEQLDHILLINTIAVIDPGGKPVNGEKHTDAKDSRYFFTPVQPWVRGLYKLQIEPRLADLAGNNLDRLFDVDLKNTSVLPGEKKIFERKWKIE